MPCHINSTRLAYSPLNMNNKLANSVTPHKGKMSNITFYDRSLSLPHYLTISGSTGVPPSTLPSTTGSNRTNHSPVKHVASPTRSSASTTDGNLLILIPALLVLIAVICLFGYLVICRKRSAEIASAQV